MNNPQKIISLSVQNFMRVSAVDIELSPEGELVILAGENEQGKSSAIKAIEYVLGGGSKVARPIRDGANEAKGVVTLTDYIVTRTTSASGTTGFKVTTRDKRAVSSPQTLLNGFIGALSFDPLEFHRQATKEPKSAVATLMKLAGLDFSALDTKRQSLYDERTDANRTLAQSKAKVVGLSHDASAPSEEITTEDLMSEFAKAQQKNKANEEIKAARGTLASELEGKRQYRLSVKDQIAEAKIALESLESGLANVESGIENLEMAVRGGDDVISALVYVDEKEIADRIRNVGVSECPVLNIKNGVSWTHVQPQ